MGRVLVLCVLCLLCLCVLGWIWCLLRLFWLRRCSLALGLGFLVRVGRLRLVLLVCHRDERKRGKVICPML